MNSVPFEYILNPKQIAQEPLPQRSASRLLKVDSRGNICDCMFSDLPSILGPNDLLVFNDTKVVPARIMAKKELTGGRVEVLLERQISDNECWVQLGSHSNRPSLGSSLVTENDSRLVVSEERDGFFRLRLTSDGDITKLFQSEGEIPLPPYISRSPNTMDSARYQTVFARAPGAVAAPTAGLHFDEDIFTALTSRGIRTAFITLHVGAGTFQPIRVNDVRDHRMHKEWFSVTREAVESILATKKSGGLVVAVGTTVVRALESSALASYLDPFEGYTDLFISSGFEFRVVDALVTNFHLPRSTLLVLVSAFGGSDAMEEAYLHAVSKGYRFYSYGDAMYIERTPLIR
ncbi:MAG: tRNA preQ1(34) S-adenosylmethionine ribosyltransferase-isomerase QueA [Acidiferrobacteraceae bacterium]|nr:tRNA preQ1(34) S-adenosylmethionine ribosyltransferase-isomerase QueA [Acidiferrobacteraceae bacterium]